jgi:hypothetical protein
LVLAGTCRYLQVLAGTCRYLQVLFGTGRYLQVVAYPAYPSEAPVQASDSFPSPLRIENFVLKMRGLMVLIFLQLENSKSIYLLEKLLS